MKGMIHILKDFDVYTSFLADEMPLFNVVDALKTKKESQKPFYY